MRDKRFITKHRGGPLKNEQHYQLTEWACACSKHVLYLLGEEIDVRLINALDVALEWTKWNVSVGDAMKFSRDAHKVAREVSNPTARAVALSVGHSVATPHMADHSLGAAW